MGIILRRRAAYVKELEELEYQLESSKCRESLALILQGIIPNSTKRWGLKDKAIRKRRPPRD
jgi:hypothetical protein